MAPPVEWGFSLIPDAQRKKFRLRFAPPQIADASLRKEETNRFASSPPKGEFRPLRRAIQDSA